MSDEAPHLIVDTPSKGVTRLQLNRPEKRNALSTPLLRDVAAAMAQADDDPEVRCVLVTGGPKIFAAGADINELADKAAEGGLADARTALWRRIRAVRTPIIAAVEGWCLGAGNELMLCCDLAVAGSTAHFGQPETNLGIIPGAGGSAALAARVGRSLALQMVLTGAPISAAQAQAAGLIAETVDAGMAGDRALEIAALIAARAPLAVQQAKAVINAACDMPLPAALAFERQAFSLILSSEDKAEGIAAFLEKRPAIWRGR